MATLYIVRHGHCESNVPDLIQGQIDSPLTELGRRQAESAAERLATELITAVYSSDLCRARDTAIPIAARHGLPVLETALLRECCLGVAQGLTVSQFAEQYPAEYRLWWEDPIANRPPGAERFEDVIERCGRFVREVTSTRAEEERIAVIGHVGSINGLICAAFDLPVRFYLGMHVANASLSIMETGKKPLLHKLNETWWGLRSME
jgi:broad specificity phosphatase PhoE